MRWCLVYCGCGGRSRPPANRCSKLKSGYNKELELKSSRPLGSWRGGSKYQIRSAHPGDSAQLYVISNTRDAVNTSPRYRTGKKVEERMSRAGNDNLNTKLTSANGLPGYCGWLSRSRFDPQPLAIGGIVLEDEGPSRIRPRGIDQWTKLS